MVAEHFKSSILDGEGAAGGNTTNDSDKESNCGSDTLAPIPKSRLVQGPPLASQEVAVN